jgi:hypothetical protein
MAISPRRQQPIARVKQITAWIDSKPGELGRIATALGKAKINISALTCWGAGREGKIHLLTNSPGKAKKILQDMGVRVTEEEVLRATLPDEPGALGELGERLGAENINIEYAYASKPIGRKKADLILSVSDVVGAAKVLRGL